jgi:hypothetical protein
MPETKEVGVRERETYDWSETERERPVQSLAPYENEPPAELYPPAEPHLPPREARRPQVVRELPQERSQSQPEAVVVMVSHSETIDQIFGALAEAQGKFGQIERTLEARIASSRANYTYAYAPLDEVLQAIRPALSEAGIAVMQFPLTRRGSVVVRTMLGHKSGQWFSNDLAATCVSQEPQEIGKVITYLRRYGLQSMTGVAPGYDDDATLSPRASEEKPQKAVRRSEKPTVSSESVLRAEPTPTAAQSAEKAPSAPEEVFKATGKIASVERRGTAARIVLDSGATAATNDAELIRSVSVYEKMSGATVKITARPHRNSTEKNPLTPVLTGISPCRADETPKPQ